MEQLLKDWIEEQINSVTEKHKQDYLFNGISNRFYVGEISMCHRILKQIESLSQKREPKFLLTVVTDDDFSLFFKGQLYTDHEISLDINDPSELNQIEVLGKWGNDLTDDVKCSEFTRGIEAIKSNPYTGYDSTGGNRGVNWVVLS